MSHAYTPGLTVSPSTLVRRERRLPLKGRVLVGPGDPVEASTVVARSELPGAVHTINLAARLAVDPARAPALVRVPVGSEVRTGEPLAESRSLFGLVRNVAESPCDGTLESVSGVTGQVLLREAPIPIEVDGYVRGSVASVLADEGVVVETHAALLQGIFGVGGETFGALTLAVDGPGDELAPERIVPAMRGRVVVGGSFVSWAALERARAAGVAAVVVGGIDDRDLRRLMGRDLGVAITGSEEIGLTLVLTEGFGRLPIADRTWELLRAHQGREASVNGATQIRAGVLRPEIVIPHDGARREAGPPAPETGLGPGVLVRALRPPNFGRIGRVVELPAELHRLETEASVRVAIVQFSDDGVRVPVPRANLEIIAG